MVDFVVNKFIIYNMIALCMVVFCVPSYTASVYKTILQYYYITSVHYSITKYLGSSWQ